MDIQHSIPLGLMRDFYLRFGWGAFTNQKIYFVDFANLPVPIFPWDGMMKLAVYSTA